MQITEKDKSNIFKTLSIIKRALVLIIRFILINNIKLNMWLAKKLED